MERYAAKDNANIDVKELPATAFEMACSIAHVVKTLVGLPMQVAIVKGLKRKLRFMLAGSLSQKRTTYAAAIAKLLHFLSFLGDVYSFDDPASPESAICMRALALSRSTIIYKRYVKAGYVAELGRRANRGRSRGAWW